MLKPILCVLAAMCVAGTAANELPSLTESSVSPVPAPETCISTDVGTLCADRARDWCENASHPVVVGIGDDSNIVYRVPERDAEQCARVGWTG